MSTTLFCTALGNRLIPKNGARTFKRVAEKAGINGASIQRIDEIIRDIRG